MTEREAFETWAVSEYFAVHRSGEQYVNTPTHHAWKGWQASRKQALEEAYDAMFEIKGCRATRFDAQTAIRSLSQPTGGKE